MNAIPLIKSRMKNPALRRVRALQFIQRRLANTPLGDIAKEFNVKPVTVSAELVWAERQGLIENYTNQILSDLVPDAIKAVKVAVARGDVKAALEVLKGTGLLTTKITAPALAGGDETLELYIRRSGKSIPSPAASSHGHETDSARRLHNRSFQQAPILDAEVVAKTVCADSDENRPAHSQQDLGISSDAAGLQPEPLADAASDDPLLSD